MNDLDKSLKKSHLLEDIINRRKEKGSVKLKYFSPLQKSHTKILQNNIIINKTDLKELSKLSERPIFINKAKTKMQKELFRSEDRRHVNNEYNNSNYNNNIYKYGNIQPKKNLVIFAECPKKLSDYILKDKNKNKKKVYHLMYLDEKDLNYEKFFKERAYQNYYSNRDYNPRIINKQNKIFNLNTYDDHYYLLNKMYTNNKTPNDNITNKNFNNNNNYTIKNLCVNNQNNDQLKVVKIQAIWRGYLLRKFLLNGLNNFYNIMKIFNCLYKILYNKSRPSFKLFLYYLQKYRNNNLYNKSKIKPSKTNIKSKPVKSREYKNINNKAQKEIININKLSVIDKRNINVFIPGGKKNKDFAKGFVYKRKNNSPKNSPLLKKKNINLDNNKRENNFKMKNNVKNYDGFKNVNYKNKVKIGINNIINYIRKKNIVLQSPLLLYRLRILHKMKMVEHRYTCLFNIIKIKEKLYLYYYFHKYRNIICSYTVNYMLSEKKGNTNIVNNLLLNNSSSKDKERSYDNIPNIKLNNEKRYILNKKENIYNNKNDINSNNNKINIINNKSILKNKENNQNLTNSLEKKSKPTFVINKNIILSKLILKKESKQNKLLLTAIFSKWKNMLNNIFVLPKLKKKKNKSNIITLSKYKSSNVPGKKFIKVRKIKSDRSNYFSQTKSINSGKISFESDNINVRKMKIQKVNILIDDKVIKSSLTKEFSPRIRSYQIVDNFNFVQKIANISRKINNKNNVFKCFVLWKKKTKENNEK